jgi:hypothetical protein
MFPVEIFRSTIEKFVAILDRCQIRFHLTGGITSAAYGEPRMTQDIDFVAEPRGLAAQLDDVLSALKVADFMFDEATIRTALRTGGMFQLFDPHESLKLAVYVRELIPGELDRSEKLEVFEGLMLPIVSRADAAASKLIWVSKGSNKSRRDLRHIFRTSEIDDQQAIIRRLAKDQQLQSLLEELLAEADELR